MVRRVELFIVRWLGMVKGVRLPSGFSRTIAIWLPSLTNWSPLKNAPFALCTKFLTRPKARSFELPNSALRPQTVEVRPFGDTRFAKTGAPEIS